MMPAPPTMGSLAFILFTNSPPDVARAPATAIRPSGPRTTFGISGSTSSNWLLGSIAMSMTARVTVTGAFGAVAEHVDRSLAH